MSELTKTAAAELLKTAMTRLAATSGVAVGISIAEMEKTANANFDEVMLASGDVLQIPDEDFEEKTFKQTFGNSNTYGVLAICIDGPDKGQAKKLYFSALKKNAVVYTDELKPKMKADGTVETVTATGELADKVRVCATIGEIAKLIKGKKIKFDENSNSPCNVASFDANRRVIGIRSTHVFNPSFA